MSQQIRIFITGLILALTAAPLAAQLTAEETIPVQVRFVPLTFVTDEGPTVLPLKDWFAVYQTPGPKVRFTLEAGPDETSAGTDTEPPITNIRGTFDVQLFPLDAPVTVTNFLTYVSPPETLSEEDLTGEFDNTMIHRSTQGDGGRVVQAGSFTRYTGEGDFLLTSIRSRGSIPLEYSEARPNTPGTIGMARLADFPDSATSSFYFNMEDNSEGFGPSNNGGFAVFGETDAAGLSLLQQVNNDIPVYNFSAQLNGAGEWPLINYTNDDFLSGLIPEWEPNTVRFSTVRLLDDHFLDPTTVEGLATSAWFGATDNASITTFPNIEVTMENNSSTAWEAGTLTITQRKMNNADGWGLNGITNLNIRFTTNDESDPHVGQTMSVFSGPEPFDYFPDPVDLGEGWLWSNHFGYAYINEWPWVYVTSPADEAEEVVFRDFIVAGFDPDQFPFGVGWAYAVGNGAADGPDGYYRMYFLPSVLTPPEYTGSQSWQEGWYILPVEGPRTPPILDPVGG